MAIFHPPSVNALQKTLDAQLLSGATASMTLNNVTSIVNGPGVVVIDRVDSNGDSTASKREYISFTGTSGSTLTGLTRNVDGGGSDQDHSVGAIVEFIFDVVQAQEIKDIVEAEHSTAGAHTTDVIAEKTAAAGVTVDGLKLKDGNSIANTGSADHITITPGTSKLIKVAILRQDNTSNAYENNSVILTGWGYVAGDTTNRRMPDTITFGITFSEFPVVLCSGGLDGESATPADINAFDNAAANTNGSLFLASLGTILTTGFTVICAVCTGDGNAGAVLNASQAFCYTWIAIGQLA